MASILVIDDSSFARKSVVRMLAVAGNHVLEAANGREGLEKAEKHKPDCIILDLLMPEMDGLEVLRALKERECAIPVIVVSADIQETTRKECMELGIVAFIRKPFNANELLDIVMGITCAK